MPFNYPFYNDGLCIFGFVAELFNLSVWESWGHTLSRLWSEQAPIYFLLQLVGARVFGFSYPVALGIQAIWCFILILFFTKLTLPQAEKHVNILPSSLLWLIPFSFLCLTGIFHPIPGGLFDFRRELIGSFALALAL